MIPALSKYVSVLIYISRTELAVRSGNDDNAVLSRAVSNDERHSGCSGGALHALSTHASRLQCLFELGAEQIVTHLPDHDDGMAQLGGGDGLVRALSAEVGIEGSSRKLSRRARECARCQQRGQC